MWACLMFCCLVLLCFAINIVLLSHFNVGLKGTLKHHIQVREGSRNVRFPHWHIENNKMFGSSQQEQLLKVITTECEVIIFNAWFIKNKACKTQGDECLGTGWSCCLTAGSLQIPVNPPVVLCWKRDKVTVGEKDRRKCQTPLDGKYGDEMWSHHHNWSYKTSLVLIISCKMYWWSQLMKSNKIQYDK